VREVASYPNMNHFKPFTFIVKLKQLFQNYAYPTYKKNRPVTDESNYQVSNNQLNPWIQYMAVRKETRNVWRLNNDVS
jgi:hypothetical protein